MIALTSLLQARDSSKYFQFTILISDALSKACFIQILDIALSASALMLKRTTLDSTNRLLSIVYQIPVEYHSLG